MLWALPASSLAGGSLSTIYLKGGFPAQHKLVIFNFSVSFNAHKRWVPERENSAKCTEIRPIQVRGYWQFQDVGLLGEVSRRLHQVPLLSVS